MPRLPLCNIKPGMIVSRDVYNDSGLFLMAKDSVVNQLCLKRLSSMDVQFVYVAPTPAALVEVTHLETTHYTRQTLAGFDQTHSLNVAGMDRLLEKTMGNILDNSHILPHLTDIRLQDMSTFIHSINVCLISTSIGVRLQLEERELYRLGLSALLHDVGMASISADILTKKDRLTASEWKTLQAHTNLGDTRLAADAAVPEACRLVAVQHHENYDGSGYPQGLSGESIHPYSRITTVADTYDSMVSKKTFSSTLQPQKACEVMLSIGGSMLDAGIVGKFMDNVVLCKKPDHTIWTRLANDLGVGSHQKNIG
ncbi:MAG: HD domain-containing phosphohydrolase [Negativicutes bacterium]|nr:HD domain-containing phosphohydrolase [Negativicutes bacterium]